MAVPILLPILLLGAMFLRGRGGGGTSGQQGPRVVLLDTREKYLEVVAAPGFPKRPTIALSADGPSSFTGRVRHAFAALSSQMPGVDFLELPALSLIDPNDPRIGAPMAEVGVFKPGHDMEKDIAPFAILYDAGSEDPRIAEALERAGKFVPADFRWWAAPVPPGAGDDAIIKVFKKLLEA